MTATNGVSMEELALATRNHGLPLEALRYEVTPVGLHYLLVHYDVPFVDTETWRLRVDGRTAAPLVLSLDELRAMPRITRRVTMECAGNGRALLEPRPISQPWLLEAVGTGDWTGVALRDVLAGAGVADDAVEIVFTGADRGVEHGSEQPYARSLPTAIATEVDVVLAYELNGAPLPPQHGHPLRLIVPGWYGMTNVKWLTAITAIDAPFEGAQQVVAYRRRTHDTDAGEALSLMAPRALMHPPGIPEFLSRERHVAPGLQQLGGRAWSGMAPIASVEVSTDGAATWVPAELQLPHGQIGRWESWTTTWLACEGVHELCCRATDAAGNRQPLWPSWNVGGYANNSVQRIIAHVP